MVNAETIKNIIIENQEFVSSIKPRKRDYEIEEEVNYVFTGSRRAGKTWFMYDIMHRLHTSKKDFKKILYINFEDERLLGFQVKDFNTLIESFRELYGFKPTLYLDEIQNVDGWEKFARRIADSNYRVYITGSNAKMLSGEIQSTIGGRYIIKEIMPFSFREYLGFLKINVDKNFMFSEERFKVKKHFEDYFYFGGFPEILKFKNKREYLNNLFQKVLYGDIITRNTIKNGFALKFIVKKLAENIHDETSFNRIKNLIISTGSKVGTATVIEYIEYMKDSFLISSIGNYYSKISSRESKKKYYFVDNGILNLFLFSPETMLLENIVYNHLYRSNPEEIYYLKNGYEIDFYLSERKELIQVCYNLENPETRKRELKAITKCVEKVPVNSVKIITKDQRDTIQIGDVVVEVIPIVSWILGAY